MRFRTHTLGAQGCALVAACVGRVDERNLFEYLLKRHYWAFKGFQPKITSIAQAKNRFADSIRNDQVPALSETLEGLMRDSTTQYFVCALSEVALRDHWHAWTKLLGAETVIGGMLFDPRETISCLAVDALASENFSLDSFRISEEGVNEAIETLRHAFGPLLALIKPLTAAAREGSPQTDQQWLQQPSSSQLSAIKSQLSDATEKLKQAEKELRRVKSDLISAQQHCSTLTTQGVEDQQALDRLRNLAKEQEADIAALKDSLASAQLGVDLRVKLEVRNHLASSLRPWIEPLVAVDHALQGPSNELLARTDQVLADQAQQDQAFGHREALRARIAALESARSKLRDARLHAIKPLAELASLEADIDHELERLRRVLQTATKPTSKDPVLSQLEVSLNAQQTFEGLAALRRFIRACVAQGLVKKADAAKLDHQARQQALRLNDRVLVDPAYVQTNAILEGKPQSPETLAQALALGLAHRILLDGYNLIFDALGYNASLGPSRAGSKPQRSMAEEGRLALIDQVKASIAHHPLIEVRIFLDSPHASDERINDQLSLHYSGGSGANRADRDIAAYLDYLKQRNDTVPTTVISKDWEVQQNAQSHHIHTLRPDHFWALF